MSSIDTGGVHSSEDEVPVAAVSAETQAQTENKAALLKDISDHERITEGVKRLQAALDHASEVLKEQQTASSQPSGSSSLPGLDSSEHPLNQFLSKLSNTQLASLNKQVKFLENDPTFSSSELQAVKDKLAEIAEKQNLVNVLASKNMLQDLSAELKKEESRWKEVGTLEFRASILEELGEVSETLQRLTFAASEKTQEVSVQYLKNTLGTALDENVKAASEQRTQLAEAIKQGLGQERIDAEQKISTFLDQSEKDFQAIGDYIAKVGQKPSPLTPSGVSSTDSLYKHFREAILVRYMPEQEKYLANLAEELQFSNLGARMGNELLGLSTDFSAAGTNFSFNTSLHKSDKGYDGDYKEAQQRLLEEKRETQRAMNETKKVVSKINDQILEVRANTKIHPEQKERLITGLKELREQSTAAVTQLETLNDVLSQIKILRVNDKEFKIEGPSDIIEQLSKAEGNVVNGFSDKEPAGGLVPISAKMNTFQQSYADQGQNQQLMLQMKMTEIQQEWSTVSTAMQILNQLYMTLAQNVAR